MKRDSQSILKERNIKTSNFVSFQYCCDMIEIARVRIPLENKVYFFLAEIDFLIKIQIKLSL
jgi:hypothetical protein